MRSRVTAKCWPTSSSVCSLPSCRPKRILMIFSSRGLRVLSTSAVCSRRFKLMTASDGDTTRRSTMKSPKWTLLLHRKLLGGWFAPQFLLEHTLRANQLIDGLDHVHRDANGTGLVRNGARD